MWEAVCVSVASFMAANDYIYTFFVVVWHPVIERVIPFALLNWREKGKVNFISIVSRVIHEQKWTRGLPTPGSSCHFTVYNTALLHLLTSQPNIKLWTLEITMIIPLHQFETRLVLPTISELCTRKIQSLKMMIVANHLVPHVASNWKRSLTNWVLHKQCRRHREMCNEPCLSQTIKCPMTCDIINL